VPHIRRLGWADEQPISGVPRPLHRRRAGPIFEDGVTGTLVTEQLDARHVRGKFLLRLAGYLRRHPENIGRTLAGLDRYATGAAQDTH
jgi:hypothetical protein